MTLSATQFNEMNTTRAYPTTFRDITLASGRVLMARITEQDDNRIVDIFDNATQEFLINITVDELKEFYSLA